jgi:hypothetical protein
MTVASNANDVIQARVPDVGGMQVMRTMMQRDDDSKVGATLDALSCDIGARPAGAPHFLHVQDALLAVRRDTNALVVDYDPAVAPILERVVAAERACCADLDWRLDRVAVEDGSGGSVLRLRAGGTPEQLEALRLLFAGEQAAEAVENGGGR